MLDIYSSDDIKSELVKLREQGWQIVGLENNIQNVKLIQSTDPKLTEVLSDKVALVLGEEVNGIDYSLYEIIDLFVEIPMQGQKESFNVSVAAGIAMYQLMMK